MWSTIEAVVTEGSALAKGGYEPGVGSASRVSRCEAGPQAEWVR